MTRTCRIPSCCSLVIGFGLLVPSAASYSQVEATLAVDPMLLQGTNPDGFLKLYSPNPLASGSSISHWDTSASPNLLMEPAIGSDLAFLDLDLTPDMLRDVGWSLGTSSFNVINLDPPGVGFTDPEPFAGAPGNAAATLGDARINVFNAVLAAWADMLDSPIDIDVEVTWQPLLPCTAGVGATLAGASTILIFQSPAFPFSDTWYHSALAEALAGTNASGSDGDILVIVNSHIDEECLSPGSGFYYGLDGQNPANLIDLAPTVLHEVGHGVGFSNFTNEGTGQLIAGDPGIFDHFTLDTTTGKTWSAMNDAERVASATNTGRVVWNGGLATTAAAALLDPGVAQLTVTLPPLLAGVYEIGTATFGPPITEAGTGGQIACMIDGTELAADDTPSNGCSAATNPQELAGTIALIDRGLCAFTEKVLNAQAAGAIAVLIANNAGNEPPGLGGIPAQTITIPAAGIGQSDGARLRDVACDFLFIDGFESGNTSVWSSTVP